VKAKKLVSHRFTMNEIEKAMDFIDTEGNKTMKVIMEW
jgi:threonine dehydrogenase-like Zn-dependent dehydrogenase